MVARDFTRRRIAPLKWHSDPVWRYSGKEDTMRLCPDNFSPEVLCQIMGVLFATTEIPSPTNDEAQPLISFAEECWGYEPHIPKRRSKTPRTQAGRLQADSAIRLQRLRPTGTSSSG